MLAGSDQETLELLRALGVKDPEWCSKVIIEIPAHGIAKLYIERYADRRGFSVLRDIGKSFEVVEVGG